MGDEIEFAAGPPARGVGASSWPELTRPVPRALVFLLVLMGGVFALNLSTVLGGAHPTRLLRPIVMAILLVGAWLRRRDAPERERRAGLVAMALAAGLALASATLWLTGVGRG